MRARGFTLIELMLVVGILGILATMSLALTTDWRRRNSHNEAAREIYNGLNRGRTEAIRRGTSVHVELGAIRMTAFIDSDGDHQYQAGETVVYQFPKATAEEPNWPGGMTIDATALSAVNIKPVAIFDYQGFSVDVTEQPLGGVITVNDARTGAVRSIELTIAGAVRIE